MICRNLLYNKKQIQSSMDAAKTIEAFNSLIVINNDRIEGYKTASSEVPDDDLKVFFSELTQTSTLCKKELIAEVERLGGVPDERTRTTGKFFRAWMKIKVALTANDRNAIVASCEYGERVALETYKNVLIQDVHAIDSAEQNLLNRQYALLKVDYDKVKLMHNILQSEKKSFL